MVWSSNSVSFSIPFGQCYGGKIDPPSSEDGDKTESFDPNGDVKPTNSQTVAEITAWLKAHEIDTTGKTTKYDLLGLVPADK